MPKLYLFTLLCLSITACKPDTPPPAAEEVPRPAPVKSELTNEEKLAMLPPAPPDCDLLPQDKIREILGEDVIFPMPGQRTANTFYSCVLDVENNKWMGQVTLEQPLKPDKRQPIIAAIADDKAGMAVEVNGTSARIAPGNDVIYVGGARPMKIRLFISPRRNAPPIFTPEKQREALISLARLVRG